MGDVAERAQRLDAALVAWDCARVGFANWSPEVAEFLNDASDEDFALWSACADLEAELRLRGWDALERLAALLNGSSRGSARHMLDGLSRDAAIAVIGAALELGWFGTPPSEAS